MPSEVLLNVKETTIGVRTDQSISKSVAISRGRRAGEVAGQLVDFAYHVCQHSPDL